MVLFYHKTIGKAVFCAEFSAIMESEDVGVPVMHEKRKGYVSVMAKEDWK